MIHRDLFQRDVRPWYFVSLLDHDYGTPAQVRRPRIIGLGIALGRETEPGAGRAADRDSAGGSAIHMG